MKGTEFYQPSETLSRVYEKLEKGQEMDEEEEDLIQIFEDRIRRKAPGGGVSTTAQVRPMYVPAKAYPASSRSARPSRVFDLSEFRPRVVCQPPHAGMEVSMDSTPPRALELGGRGPFAFSPGWAPTRANGCLSIYSPDRETVPHFPRYIRLPPSRRGHDHVRKALTFGAETGHSVF